MSRSFVPPLTLPNVDWKGLESRLWASTMRFEAPPPRQEGFGDAYLGDLERPRWNGRRPGFDVSWFLLLVLNARRRWFVHFRGLYPAVHKHAPAFGCFVPAWAIHVDYECASRFNLALADEIIEWCVDQKEPLEAAKAMISLISLGGTREQVMGYMGKTLSSELR